MHLGVIVSWTFLVLTKFAGNITIRLRCRSNQNLICSKYNSIRSYIFKASMACYSNNRTLSKHLLELKMCFVLVLLAAASCVSFNNFPLENYYLFEVVISLTTQKNSELSLKVQTNSPLYSWQKYLKLRSICWNIKSKFSYIHVCGQCGWWDWVNLMYFAHFLEVQQYLR